MFLIPILVTEDEFAQFPDTAKEKDGRTDTAITIRIRNDNCAQEEQIRTHSGHKSRAPFRGRK